jgi:hypothetical protein
MPVAVAVATTVTTLTNDADPTKKRTFDEVDNHDGNHDNDNDNLDLESGLGMAAFFHYAEANHAKVKEKLGTDAKAFGKVAAELANNYRALSADEIKKWQVIALTVNTNFAKGLKLHSQPTLKTRKKKDKDAPKGPVSAYFHYMVAHRAQVVAEDTSRTFGDVAKVCSAKYRVMKDEEKKEWEDKADADKLRYKHQLEVYEKEQAAKPPQEPEEEDEHEAEADTPKKKKKKQAKPKRPDDAPKWYQSAYNLYMNANREAIKLANPSLPQLEVARIGSANLALAPDEWTEKATADRARYDQEMEVYISKQQAADKKEREEGTEHKDVDNDEEVMI